MLLPTYILPFVIAVVAAVPDNAGFVNTNVAGAAGTVAVTVNSLAVLSALGATFTVVEGPTPFTAFTPNTRELIAGATLAKLT